MKAIKRAAWRFVAAMLLLLALAGAPPAMAQTFQEAVAAYERGDYVVALRGFRIYAKQGHASAQNNLGVMYANGQGVPQDYVEAVKWYRLAAEQGDASAQHSLGFMYSNGQGVLQDYVQAHKWFNFAASRSQKGSERDSYIWARDAVGSRLMPEAIAEAQRLARAWRPRKESPAR